MSCPRAPYDNALQNPASQPTTWDDREPFEASTKSESFRRAHAGARRPEGVYLGHPQFEGFEAVL